MKKEITYKNKERLILPVRILQFCTKPTESLLAMFSHRVSDLLGVFWQLVFLYTAHRFTDHESEGSMTPPIKLYKAFIPYDHKQETRTNDKKLLIAGCLHPIAQIKMNFKQWQ